LPEMADAGVSPLDRGTASPLVAVALVGFMGAGKTTVGRALAQRTGWHFEDLDELIEKNQGQTIAEIFEERGEARFRDLERLLLREALRLPPPFVLALGGGAFCQNEVQNLLRTAGIPAVFLDAPVDELYRRGAEDGVLRPLRRDEEAFRRLYQERRPAYLGAALAIETWRKPVAAIVDEIISALNLEGARGVWD
jgi:shikimate kinase